MPTRPNASSGTSTRGRSRSPAGIAAIAARPRASIAAAVGSLASRARNTPLSTSRTFATPIAASSTRVRSASVSDEVSGRATSTRVVTAGSRRAAFEAA